MTARWMLLMLERQHHNELEKSSARTTDVVASDSISSGGMEPWSMCVAGARHRQCDWSSRGYAALVTIREISG